MKRILLLIVLFAPLAGLAQEKFGVKLSGFVSAETFWDSRAMVAAREGDILLYPKNVAKDTKGVDVNDQASFNMVTIFSRVRAKITAPDVLGAKVTGLIEMDFGGTGETTMGLVRMRHAFVKLSWAKLDLLTGQYWHPLFAPECYPIVTSWGGGLPVSPLARNPQVRLTYKPNSGINLMVAALSHRDFSPTGPTGKSSEYLRNSAIPELQAQFIMGLDKSVLFGMTAGYKTLVPQLKNYNGVVVDESIGSYNVNVFAKYHTDKLAIRVQAVYGENMNQFVMLGGYAVAKEGSNLITGNFEYTNIATGSAWLDVNYKASATRSYGVFAGLSKNHGAEEEVIHSSLVYSRGADIDYLYRVAPRVMFSSGKFKFTTELSYTAAAYGSANTAMLVEDSEEVGGFRLLFSTLLSF